MTDEKDEKVVATIAFVIRGRQKRLHSWVATLPADLEIVETHHHDEGIVILSMEEVDGLRTGDYLAVHRDTRKRIGKRRWKKTTPTEPEAGPSAPTEPTSPPVTGQEAKP